MPSWGSIAIRLGPSALYLFGAGLAWWVGQYAVPVPHWPLVWRVYAVWLLGLAGLRVYSIGVRPGDVFPSALAGSYGAALVIVLHLFAVVWILRHVEEPKPPNG